MSRAVQCYNIKIPHLCDERHYQPPNSPETIPLLAHQNYYVNKRFLTVNVGANLTKFI